MTPRERFIRTLNFQQCDDRLPLVEWAAWWDLTIKRWKTEGMPPELDWDQSLACFDLDPLVLIGAGAGPAETPPEVAPIVTDAASYEALRPYLFTEAMIAEAVRMARQLKPRHDRGEIAIRVWLDGYFWFPRKLFGIEPHMLAFYDQPALMHRMNSDLADFNCRMTDAICEVLRPEMVGFAEDMSYNHGPMISRRTFEEFVAPYYRILLPRLQERNIMPFIDTDGDVTLLVPWYAELGVDGFLPLERQAGVDGMALRQKYPRLRMIGHFDKMTMNQGEAAMRAEFERLLPLMRTGGFIPSVDHQTPPGVSLEQYRVYLRLLKQFMGGAQS